MELCSKQQIGLYNEVNVFENIVRKFVRWRAIHKHAPEQRLNAPRGEILIYCVQLWPYFVLQLQLR